MLTDYIEIKNEIKHIEERIQLLNMRRTSPRASIITDMPTAPTFSNDKMDKDLIKLEELEEKYKEILSKLYTEQIKVEESLQKLTPIEREVIRCRYFDGMNWIKIQRKLHISQRTSFRIHKRALEKLGKISN